MSSSVPSITQWQQWVAELLPNLSRSEVRNLGLLSYGIVIFDGCGLTRLSQGLAKLEQVPAGRLRQRLREFYYEAEAKRGRKRREVDVQACFAPLLTGVLQGWQGEKVLALSLDASTLGERFTVLFAAIGTRVQRRGRGWKGPGEWSEGGERMRGTLLVRWEKGYEEQVAEVTDLDEKEAEVAWYLMRFWIEDEYKDHKSGGWGWQETKMVDARRAERLWLAMAVAMQRAVLVGGQEEAKEQVLSRRKARQGKQPRRVGRPAKPLCKPRGREQSCLVRGQQSIQAAVIRGEALPQGQGVSEPWPKQTYQLRKPTSSWAKKRKEKETRKRKKHQQQQRIK